MSEEMNEVKDYEELEDEKLLVYCETYLKTFSKTKAYLACHPNSSETSAIANASRLHKNPKVIGYLAMKLNEKVMGNDEFLVILGERARDTSNKQAQLKALELLGRVKGIFIDRTDVTTAGEKISWQQFITSEEVKQTHAGTVLNLDKPRDY